LMSSSLRVRSATQAVSIACLTRWNPGSTASFAAHVVPGRHQADQAWLRQARRPPARSASRRHLSRTSTMTSPIPCR
jgi:hypothetical protein